MRSRRRRVGEALTSSAARRSASRPTRRCPRASTCAATAYAPPSSSITSVAEPGAGGMSTSTAGNRRSATACSAGWPSGSEYTITPSTTLLRTAASAGSNDGGTGSSVSATSARSPAVAIPCRNSTAPGSANANESASAKSTPSAPARPRRSEAATGSGPRSAGRRRRPAPARAARPRPGRAGCTRTRRSSARRRRAARRPGAWGGGPSRGDIGPDGPRRRDGGRARRRPSRAAQAGVATQGTKGGAPSHLDGPELYIAAGHVPVDRSTTRYAAGVDRFTHSSIGRTASAVSVVFAGNGVLFASLFARLPEVQARLGLGDGELGLALLGAPSGWWRPVAGRRLDHPRRLAAGRRGRGGGIRRRARSALAGRRPRHADGARCARSARRAGCSTSR